MYRSASWTRVPDHDYLMHSSSSPSPSTKGTAGLRMSSSFESSAELPVYDEITEMAKKEKARVKFAENAVHVIPLVLIICALILWFHSNPEIDVVNNLVAARIEGLTIEGEIDNDSDGTQTGIIPIVDTGDGDFKSNSRSINVHLKRFGY